MTTPRYPSGCTAVSQVHRDAVVGSSASAWNVNFNNGNVNNNHRNNNGFALAVRRAGEFQGEVQLQPLFDAWRLARRQKVPSHNQLRFDTQWMDRLLQLQQALNSNTWKPRPSTCFIALRPKAREIHAPDFADRVVHHWLVPQIERFLADRLQLSLKADIRLRPLTDGIDFLGYVVRPTHTLVRPRVVAHAREALATWERQHVTAAEIRATPAQLRQIQSTAASYAGHLRHANSYRLQAALRTRFPWLTTATLPRRFHHQLEGKAIAIPCRAIEGCRGSSCAANLAAEAH